MENSHPLGRTTSFAVEAGVAVFFNRLQLIYLWISMPTAPGSPVPSHGAPLLRGLTCFEQLMLLKASHAAGTSKSKCISEGPPNVLHLHTYVHCPRYKANSEQINPSLTLGLLASPPGPGAPARRDDPRAPGLRGGGEGSCGDFSKPLHECFSLTCHNRLVLRF